MAAPINAGLAPSTSSSCSSDPGPGARAPDRGSTPACGPSRRRSPAPSASKPWCCSDRPGRSRSATPMRPGSSSSPKRQRQHRRRSSRASRRERTTSPRSSTRRNHGDAQAGGAHPRERGGRRVVPRRDPDPRRRLGHLRRIAPLPRERARRHAARSAASRPVDGVGGSRGLPRSALYAGSGASSSTTGSPR